MKKQLDELVGKKILRLGKPVVVVNWVVKGGKYILDLGNTRWVIGYDSDLPDFFENLEFYKETAVEVKTSVQVSNFNENSRSMTDTLLSVFFNLEKNCDDAEIKRAKAMVDVANTVVNIELAKHKLMNAI